MNIVITHPVAGFTGQVILRGTAVQLPFTNGTATVDVDPTALEEILLLGFSFTVGAPGPAPAYDANLDVSMTAVQGSPASQFSVAQRAAFVAPDVICAKATGTAATDTANLQAAINATPDHGWLHIPGGTYYLNAALTISKNIKVTGAGVFETPGIDDPRTAPYLYGTVLRQTTSATDVLKINGTSLVVHLSDFGVMFDPTIAFTNTGHGINATPPTSGTGFAAGITHSLWSNLAIWGHDGNHYGRYLVNAITCTMQHIRSYGGGGLFLQGMADGNLHYGNHVEIHPVVMLFSVGSADGYHLAGPSSSANGALNLLTFIRPQVNVYPAPGVTPPTAAQYLWNEATSVTFLHDITITSPDFENDLSGVYCPMAFGTKTYIPAGGLIAPPSGSAGPWYRREKRYNSDSTVAPTVSGGSGAGTSPTVTLQNGSNDLSGIINVTAGTSPGGAGSTIATVTFATPMTNAALAVLVAAMYNPPPGPFYVNALSTTSFAIRCTAALTAASSYSIAYRIEQ